MTIEDSNGIIYTIVGDCVTVGTDDSDNRGNALPQGKKLKSLNLHEYVSNYKVTRIGNCAFSNSELISAFIPASVTSMGYDAFAYSYSLKNVRFAEGSELTKLEQGVFYSCNKIKEIRIPPSVSSIVNHALANTNIDHLYYCGINVFSGSGPFISNVKYYPKMIFVRENYSSNSFYDCTQISKTNMCSVPLHEPLRCTMKSFSHPSNGAIIILTLMLTK